MCGIAAAIGQLSPDSASTALRAMIDSQRHRGPDDQGWIVEPTEMGAVGLGNRRLAIQDLSEMGHQPMRNAATGDILVYNGELYNAVELKGLLTSQGHRFCGHSDTEVVLRCYQQWGINCLQRFRGMFAFALWDRQRMRLLVARDHLGIKPLYYSQADGQRFICASEVRALVASGLVDGNIDRRGLAGYLAYGGVQEPLTIYEEISCLLPGSWLEIDSLPKVMAQGTYWSFPSPSQQRRQVPARQLFEEGRERLQQSVSRHLLSDVPLGVFLSSGLDSTAILGLSLHAQSASPPEAFTVTFPDAPEYSEAAITRDTAARLGVSLHECPVSNSTAEQWLCDGLERMDQPSMDGFNTYIVAKAVRERGMAVALAGTGGDELFGGYSNFWRLPQMCRWLKRLPPPLRASAAWLATIGKSHVLRQKSLEIAKGEIDVSTVYLRLRRLLTDGELQSLGLLANELGLTRDFQVSSLLPLNGVTSDAVAAISRLETAYYLRNILLRDTDVFGMANSLEIRVPFLDRDVVDWTFSLPGDVLLPRRAQSKHILRNACAGLYSATQLHQPKRGFTLPFSNWLRGSLRDRTEAYFDQLRTSGILDSVGLDRIHHGFYSQDDDRAWSRVWALVTLASWLHAQDSSKTHAAPAAAV